jgi:membrane protease YdiL (CAAX protease family)
MQKPPDQPAETAAYTPIPPVPWNGGLGTVFIILIFYITQFISSFLLIVYPLIRHWSNAQTTNWLNNSVPVQFIFFLVTDAMVLGAIYLFLRAHKVSWGAIALRRPRWRDPLFGAIAWVVYYIVFQFLVLILSRLIPALNVNQKQDIGFNNVHGLPELTMTFISLVLLPPLTEELMVRGFLYGSLKKVMPLAGAVILTSLLFASAHLDEGGGAGPLYIAAIDTFLLSLALIYLREKTNSLWASMSLHAIKNGVAFMALFLFTSR